MKKSRVSSSSRARRNQLIGVASKPPPRDATLTCHEPQAGQALSMPAFRSRWKGHANRPLIVGGRPTHRGSHVSEGPHPLELWPRVRCLRGGSRSFVALVLSFHRISILFHPGLSSPER